MINPIPVKAKFPLEVVKKEGHIKLPFPEETRRRGCQCLGTCTLSCIFVYEKST
jgi:hypothetical protein